jgi:uncharacterized membrane protein
MNIIFYLKLYFATFLVFLGIDFVWLTRVAPAFYQKYIGHLLAEKPNLTAAAIFYIVNIIGIIIFAIVPALNKNSLTTAATLGALYGFMTYATYDLTNLATLRDWPVRVSIVDIIWGTILTAAVASAGYYIGTKL